MLVGADLVVGLAERRPEQRRARRPVRSRSTHWVLAISSNVPGSPSWVRCGWVKVWLPIHIPARRSARTRSGWASALLPWSNIVARRWLDVSAASNWSVVALGPSSKVRPT